MNSKSRPPSSITADESLEIAEAVVGCDGVLTLYTATSSGVMRRVTLGVHAQGIILKALLGSSIDPLDPTSKRFVPLGLSRFRLNDEVGLSFLLSPHVGIHLLLDRSLAGALNELLATFDDASTWRIAKVN